MRVHEELVEGGRDALLPGAHRLLPPARHRPRAQEAGRPATTSRPARRCSTTPRRTTPRSAASCRRVQTASLVLCYSRMIFIQLYPRFTRFECKVFLDRRPALLRRRRPPLHDRQHARGGALGHGQGHGARCRRWWPSPSASASRSPRTRRATPTARRASSGPSTTSRTTSSPAATSPTGTTLNREARAWCDKVNADPHASTLHASAGASSSPAEQPQLKPLPLWVPEVYAAPPAHRRRRGLRQRARATATPCPYQLIGRQLEVRETKERDRGLRRARGCVATHATRRRAARARG